VVNLHFLPLDLFISDSIHLDVVKRGSLGVTVNEKPFLASEGTRLTQFGKERFLLYFDFRQMVHTAFNMPQEKGTRVGNQERKR